MNMKSLTLATLSALVLATSAMAGPDCNAAYSRKCNFGAPFTLPPNQIFTPTDVDNFCRQTTISCSLTECVARISVLAGIVPGAPKPDSCLPAGYRGK